ncbi:IS1595 family transposase [Aliarcobacter butzleri]|uniref:IS1595 family transposase n=1 Tax=Aliarcobacter butzleri TaxID=28197 RepID=A0AAW7Q753_9BACT|nr:IS1595 family transposase [Aliarcobacter butzleri]MDN5114882.1 IS1595 family transposase [Aliarcobacter butzleri]
MINKDFNSILDLINAFPNEETCIKHLEELRWNGYVVSPFDRTSTVYECSNNRYRCKNTSKYFNVKTGTLFDNTKVKLQKWFIAIWLVTSHKKGVSSLQLAKDINLTQKTAWFMLQKIRACFGIGNDLDNTVEVDETYVGSKNKNRHQGKKVLSSQGRNAKDKTPIVGIVGRQAKLNEYVVENVKSETLTTEIIRSVKHTASLYTDEWLGYKGVSKIYVKHNQGEYVNGRVHTNTIEGFWSLLKRGIVGIYHFTSKKHLQRYVDEFVFRYNTRTRKKSESERFNLLLTNTEIRTTYKGLING